MPVAGELIRLIVVACVRLVGPPPLCEFADCNDIAAEQVFTGTLKAPVPKRRLVIFSDCITEVSPVETTVITGLPIIVSL